jgi:hypothetical protein
MMVEQVIAQVLKAEKSSRLITAHIWGTSGQMTTLGAVPWFNQRGRKAEKSPVARPSRVYLSVNSASTGAV